MSMSPFTKTYVATLTQERVCCTYVHHFTIHGQGQGHLPAGQEETCIAHLQLIYKLRKTELLSTYVNE